MVLEVDCRAFLWGLVLGDDEAGFKLAMEFLKNELPFSFNSFA